MDASQAVSPTETMDYTKSESSVSQLEDRPDSHGKASRKYV